MLIRKKSFQDEALSFRKKWLIGDEGLKDEEVEGWWHWLGRETDKFIASKDYNDNRRTLLKKIEQAKKSKDYKTYDSCKSKLTKLDQKTPLNKFYSEIDEIMKKYSISQHYHKTVMLYLTNNTLVYIPRDNVGFWFERDKEDKKTYRLFLEVFSNTTIKDIENVWPLIKRYKKRTMNYKEGRNKPKTNFNRDLRIYDLREKGLSYSEIAKKINEEFKGKALLYDDIGIILNRIKKRITDI